MSFTTEIKDEICMLEFSKAENISELSGFVRNNKIKETNKLILSSENPKVARRVYTLLKNIYDVNPEINQNKGVNFTKKYFYTVETNDKINIILRDLMYLDENNKKIGKPKEYLIDSEDLSRSYLRGSFLASGSLNDPKKSRYHLEYLIEEQQEAEFISDLLTKFNINNKILERDTGYMVYVKEAEKIGDFLRIISANRAVLYYEDIRIYRDHKNMTNRLNNCEQANVDKVILSSEKQIEDIDIVIKEIGLDLVDDKLKEAIIYRKKYPEASLNDLSYIITKETNKPITKSGLNHRFRKISELRKRIEQQKKD